MGIKFFCPNGHKLNVKSFLSGKKAICPKCGARVLVPPESVENFEPDSTAATEAATDGAIVEVAATAGAVASAAMAAAPNARVSIPTGSTPKSPVGSAPMSPVGSAPMSPVGSAPMSPVGSAPMSPVGSAPMSPVAPAPTLAAPIAATPMANNPINAAARIASGSPVRDPIDEAPTAVWYVRPAGGGQFGPAPGETMRAWIDEGRVTGTALVWRAGWPEWRSAAAAFPRLAAPAPGWPGAPQVVAAPALNAPFMPAPSMAPAMPGWAGGGVGLAPVSAVGAQPAGLPVGQVIGELDSPAALYGDAAAEDAVTRNRKKRRQKNDVTMALTGVLVVLTIVLVIILALVLNRESNTAPETKPAAKEPAKTVKSADTDGSTKLKPGAGAKNPLKNRKPPAKKPASEDDEDADSDSMDEKDPDESP